MFCVQQHSSRLRWHIYKKSINIFIGIFFRPKALFYSIQFILSWLLACLLASFLFNSHALWIFRPLRCVYHSTMHTIWKSISFWSHWHFIFDAKSIDNKAFNLWYLYSIWINFQGGIWKKYMKRRCMRRESMACHGIIFYILRPMRTTPQINRL